MPIGDVATVEYALDDGYAERRQVIKAADGGVERPLLGEGADVQFVDHRAADGRTAPAAVGPGEGDGAAGAFFERDFDKVVFLEQTLSWPHFGDPTFTFSDVERAIKHRLRASKVIGIFRMLEADATRRRELVLLARLQEKYGARAAVTDLAPIG